MPNTGALTVLIFLIENVIVGTSEASVWYWTISFLLLSCVFCAESVMVSSYSAGHYRHSWTVHRVQSVCSGQLCGLSWAIWLLLHSHSVLYLLMCSQSHWCPMVPFVPFSCAVDILKLGALLTQPHLFRSCVMTDQLGWLSWVVCCLATPTEYTPVLRVSLVPDSPTYSFLCSVNANFLACA